MALCLAGAFLLPAADAPAAHWWPAGVEEALQRAGTNRAELVQALEKISTKQRDGMAFLIENMPAPDLASLASDFLLENVSLAYEADARAAWAGRIPKEFFLNGVLPYASVNEARDNWRKRLREISLPLVKDSKTPTEAAMALNAKLFPLVKVKYSTARRRPDQGPFETMESGVATCTGLSILLVDACRSVGVPARVVGTPLWFNKSGNHTWVEIWDGGWHFLGAAEPDPAGLDRGWFVHNASQALKDPPEHGIYASSFKRTGLSFPLSWARRLDYVSAENVTDRYAAKAKPADSRKVRLNLDVFNRPASERVVAKVTVTDAADPAVRFEGNSKGPSADGNDHLFFELPAQRTFVVETEQAGTKRRQNYTTRAEGEDLLKIFLTEAKPAGSIQVHLNVDVFNRPVGERVVAKVTVTDAANPAVRFEGNSKDASADGSDHLFFELPAQRTFVVETEQAGTKRRQFYTTRAEGEDLLKIFLTGVPDLPPIAQQCFAPPAVAKALPPRDAAKLKAALTGFFNADSKQQANLKFSASLEKLLAKNEAAVRHLAWEAFCAATNHGDLRQNFAEGKVRFQEHVSPYTVKTVGARPANGWALVIAMHGGGNAPQEVNDRQWKQMQGYYRDHPEAGGYRYVALRAPDNTWNGFYTDYAYPLVANLVRQFLLYGDVDPDKVFLMGYSHGGYGAFAIGPKMPDRFAAIHASAANLADGAVADTLRNTVFICMVGEKDTAYGRIERVKEFKAEIQRLRGDRTDVFPVTVQIIADHPHSGLPDRDSIADIYPAVRNPVPRELIWPLTDQVISDFFWLHVAAPGKGQRLEATCRDNKLTVTSTPALASATVLLDDRLVDFSKPVTLVFNGKTSKAKLHPSLHTLCETLQRRGDPDLAFTAALSLPGTSTSQSQ